VWYQDQIKFLTTHRYYTEAARSLRGEGKQRNIGLLQSLIQQQKAAYNLERQETRE
jgi:hypothetical protein